MHSCFMNTPRGVRKAMCLGVNKNKKGDKMKNIKWSHFETRKRYNKETGESWYERLLIGIMVGGESAGRNSYIENIPGLQAGDCVYVFSLGSKLDQKNILFVHKKGDSVVYANMHSMNQPRAREYIDFYANESGCEIQAVDWLPTVFNGTGGGKIDSLESALEKAMNTNIEF